MKFRIPSHRIRPAIGMAAWLAVSWSWFTALPADAYIGEPETLVYGRIVNRRNPNAEQRVTEGELRWTIRNPDGSLIELAGEVDTLGGGGFSYLLRIPHQALMLGQQAVAGTVPLGTTTTVAHHEAITLDGSSAGILPPASSGFDLDQLLRASAIRIDLEINADSDDTDGDGMPDWWEDEHGLDKQDAGDALTDLNGDGISNLASYLAGTDPEQDPTQPLLLTDQVIAYAGADSLVPLEVADSDSTPAQLTFTLYLEPTGGRLLLRNASALPAPTDRVLVAGDTFTRADVLAGRLVFEHEAGTEPGSLDVGVRDEDPLHEESRGEVAVLLFESNPLVTPTTPSEVLRREAHRLALEENDVVVDFGATAGPHLISTPSTGLTGAAYQSHMAAFGPDRPHVLLGGPSTDQLNGGAASDLLFGDDGADKLSGGSGADRFMFLESASAVDVITDFTPAQGDVIDLSAVLHGSSNLLSNYVRIRRSGSDALVEVSAAGTNTGFTDLVIRLQGSTLQSSDLAGLYYAGNLETGAIGLPPRLSLVATTPQASENGPTDGVFTITREGSIETDLTVALLISGSATNGTDYQFIPSSILLPAGEKTATVTVRPYVDAQVEFNEVVFISLVSSPDYLLASASSAQVTIEDLKPQISLEVLEGLASVEEASPAMVLMRRGGLLSPEVFVQFTLSGTAVNGVDYNYVTPYQSLSAGQTTKMLEFVPKPSVNFGSAEAKSIRMTVKPDASYTLPVPAANLMVVPRRLSYDTWLADNGLAAAGDDGSYLLRYGFGLGASGQTSAGNLRLPRASDENGYLTIRFRRKPAAADLQYRVEYTNDWTGWATGPAVVEDITSQVAPNDPGAAVFRAKQPIADSDMGALRVRLSLLESSNP